MEELFVLDHVEELKLSEDDIENSYEERMALARLANGLFWLNREVAKFESRAREKAKRKNIVYDLVGGEILKNMPCGLLSCAFHWYAISACNYAQLVGWLATHDTKSAKAYVKKTMPKLLYYRNKVAAHFAITDPYQQDNEADLAASIMTQIVFISGHLCAAALSPILDGQNNEKIEVSKTNSWSLTQVHNHLVKRYWPNGKPKNVQAIKVPKSSEITLKADWSNIFEDGA
ncbi:MAG: hypothetical protein K8R77_09150 [Anaerolineaceae bacterium]|nr:hypothetical protein [Anaerolineaceae bacterium]